MPADLGSNPADVAAASIERRYIGRLFGIPFTRLGRSTAPASIEIAPFRVGREKVFNYWWQAHLIDACVLAAQRHHSRGDQRNATRLARLGERVLRGTWIANGLHMHNRYFDDMAWLALATLRLEHLYRELGSPLRARLVGLARWRLSRQLARGAHPDGGSYWNKDRLFVNAAASSPIALFAAQTGHISRARTLVDWVYSRLFDVNSGLIWDGWYPDADVVTDVYTYNQGTTIAALLAIGDVERADSLITGVARALEPGGALHHESEGDGGLFPGILARYLATACLDDRVAQSRRDLATDMIRRVATRLWEGRWAKAGIFSPDPQLPAPRDGAVELSTQLSAWLIFESAELVAGEYHKAWRCRHDEEETGGPQT